MTIAQLLKRARAFLTGPERAAKARAEAMTFFIRAEGAQVFDPRIALTEAKNVVHQAEKEFEMISQAFQNALDHIKARDAAAAQQVSDANAARDAAVAASQAKDAQISDLTAKLADATQQIADEEAAIVAAAADAPAPAPAVDPAAPPADGSASADVQP